MPMQSVSRAQLLRSRAAGRHVAARFLAALQELRARLTLRRSLGKLSERQLRDAGLIPHDLDAALARELSHAAAPGLEAAARRRAGNW